MTILCNWEPAACLVGLHPSQGQTANAFMQYHIIPMDIMDINPSVEGLTAQPYVFKGGALLTVSTAPSPQWSKLQERCHLHSTLKQSQACGQRPAQDAGSQWKDEVHRRNLTTSAVPDPCVYWDLTATLISKKNMARKLWTVKMLGRSVKPTIYL